MSTLYVCPECGSAATDYSELVGGSASCRVCKWEGHKDELLAVAAGDQDNVQQLMAMSSDFRKIMSTHAKETIQFLAKWGFLGEGDKDFVTKQAVRYLSAMARASMESIIKERETIESERVHAQH